MRTPTDPDLLALWETAGRLPHPLRASAVLVPVSDVEVATMPLGERDAALLRWYARTAGPTLDATTSCPHCGQDVDVTVPVDDLVVVPGSGAGVLEVAGYTVRFHPPTAGEVADALASGPGAEEGADALLRACVDECAGPGGDLDPRDLPPAVRDALDAALADADPGAELTLALDCPTCASRWTDVLDPLAFVWQVVETRATGLVEQVHVLASAYGWSERDILALPRARRALYLDVIGR